MDNIKDINVLNKDMLEVKDELSKLKNVSTDVTADK